MRVEGEGEGEGVRVRLYGLLLPSELYTRPV